jgi:hypothetical protein
MLAKSLTKIGDVLGRIKLTYILYPTPQVQHTVSEIYSKIIRFFLKAERWYQQGKLRRAWEALSKPVELYYNDLIEEVEECTKEIEALATAGAHAEQRDMHLEIQVLTKKVQSTEDLLREMLGRLICMWYPTFGWTI